MGLLAGKVGKVQGYSVLFPHRFWYEEKKKRMTKKKILI